MPLTDDEGGLLGQILTANVRYSQSLTNRVEQDAREDYVSLARKFQDAYDRLVSASDSNDMRRVDYVLSQMYNTIYYMQSTVEFHETQIKILKGETDNEGKVK